MSFWQSLVDLIFPKVRTRILFLLDSILMICGLLSIIIMIREVGWFLNDSETHFSYHASKGILTFFVLQAFLRFFIQTSPIHYILRHKLHAFLALLSIPVLLLGDPLAHILHNQLPWLKMHYAILAITFLTQAPVAILILVRLLRKSPLLGLTSLSPATIFSLSFGIMIAIGTFLLKMPNATPGISSSISWIDALFTSTSAVCVTGLIVVDTATAFTPLGKLFILGLIQIGGLGIMTLTVFLSLYLTGGGSLRTKIIMQDLLDQQSLSGIANLLKRIITYTFTIEAIGAVLLYISLKTVNATSGVSPFSSAVFHAVSAFCNAGFSLYTNNLCDPSMRTNTLALMAIIILVTLGGLGFPVLKSVKHFLARASKYYFLRGRQGFQPRLDNHSKIVLITSIILTFGGAVIIGFFEQYPLNVQGILTALLSSVTCRTAGFNNFGMANLTQLTLLFMLFLMFVGASPGGTGGGIKTTTFSVTLLNIWRILRGKQNLVLFGRSINPKICDRAMVTIILCSIIIALAAGVVNTLQPQLNLLDILFECTSAFGTVGLSRGITSSLCTSSKLIIIGLMFVGRIGLLMLVVSFFQPADTAKIAYPEENINL